MSSLEPLVRIFIVLFQLAGACIIIWGGARTIYYFFMPTAYPLVKNKIISLEELLRVELGQKIVFALEFLVAGDILATLLGPTLDDLLQLGLLVFIRTVLSFFVGREMKNLDIHKHQLERELFLQSRKIEGKVQVKK